MPNHVHVLFSLHANWKLEQLLKSWKGFTGRAIHDQLGERGEFWQKDYFDRLVRHQSHFFFCARYIRNNAREAGLKDGEFLLYESEFVRRVLG